MKAGTIVFDVGKVLLSFEPERVASLLPAEHRAALKEAMFGAVHRWSEFDLGRKPNEQIAEEIAAAAGVPGGADRASRTGKRNGFDNSVASPILAHGASPPSTGCLKRRKTNRSGWSAFHHHRATFDRMYRRMARNWRDESEMSNHQSFDQIRRGGGTSPTGT